MKKEIRTIVYDEILGLEAYRLEGIVQAFPDHFHEYYVVGVMMQGQRFMKCKQKQYHLKKGDIVVFNPNDIHTCAQLGEEPLSYWGINIPTALMRKLMVDISGQDTLPQFKQAVLQDEEIRYYLSRLHEMLMEGYKAFVKEEYLYTLLSLCIEKNAVSFEQPISDCSEEIEKLCKYIKQHYEQALSLQILGEQASLSKSTLLRAFTKYKGITPYRYIETIRIQEAKKFLEQGMLPKEVAMQTGFSDQSHFTNYFTSYIGVTPALYRSIFINEKEEIDEK